MRVQFNPYESPRSLDEPVMAELADDLLELPELRAAHRALVIVLLGVAGIFAAEGMARGEHGRVAVGALLAAGAVATTKEADWRDLLGKVA